MLTKLPVEILLEKILSLVDSKSLINLSMVSKHLNYLANDEHLWRNLCFEEFNIPQDNVFRYKGWKHLYIALKVDTKVFTWGENHDDRLGLRPEQSPSSNTFQSVRNPRFRHLNQVSEPQEVVSLQEKNIIDIISGGWSFHALDTSGSVWMWGTMQQDITPRMSIGTKRFVHPVKLQELNETQERVPFRSISTGRGHVIGLARDGHVWHWSNHITLQRVSLPLKRDEKVVQVVANWNYSSVLTDKGALFIVPKPDWIIPSQAQVEPAATTIVAPRVDFSTLYPEEPQDEIVQLTGLDGYTLALTRSGRVLKLATGNIEEFSRQPTHHVQELIHFGAKKKEEVNERDGSMKRFITGNFDNFAVYTKDGKVLLGKVDAASETQPVILLGLQNKDICKVSFGDYHCGAVTNEGKLLTWGNYSSGALGHGPNYQEAHKSTPTVVEALNDMYVFAIGFGGWQSSVLAIPNFTNNNSNRTETSKTYNDDDSGNFIRTDI